MFSRQRYWGEPMPLIHCPHCGTVPVPEDQLPLQLPEVQKYEPTGTGESPLANVDEWVNCTCPVCGAPAKRETNTMPQWAGSCWYYLRYLDPHNDKEFASRDKVDYWMPVDLYVGGAEHAVLHLLYARFWHKVLFDLGLVNTDEPFMRLVNQGMITSFAYQRPDKSLVAVDQVDENGGVYTEKGTGVKLERVIAKMSKSLKNVINPDEIIKEYGADSLRLYEMFMGPLQMSKPWSTQGLQGVHRFLQKVWKVCTKPLSDEPMPADLKKLLQLALLTGVSMILFLVEAQIPPLVPVPGVKLGLGNIIVVCVLFYYGRREALAVLCVKVLLSALLTGQMGALIYSAAGGLLSLGVMCAVKGLVRQNQLWAASVLGGLSHNVGQLLAAMAVSATPGLLAYLPVLALSGMLTGLFTGLAAQAVVARLRR